MAASKVDLLQGTLDLMVSDNNRKAKFYSITKDGKRQVRAERSNWERLAAVMGRVLAATAQGGRR